MSSLKGQEDATPAPLAISHAEMNAAIDKGDAKPLSQSHGWRARYLNAWFRRLVQLDNGDWRAPALWALRYHHNDPKFLHQFFERLERLAASMFIRRVYTSPNAT